MHPSTRGSSSRKVSSTSPTKTSPTKPTTPNTTRTSKVLASSAASHTRPTPSSQMRHYKKATTTTTATSKPTTAHSTNNSRKKAPSPTTPVRKQQVDTGISEQDYPTIYHRVSLKDEKAVLLNDGEMIAEFERHKRRYDPFITFV